MFGGRALSAIRTEGLTKAYKTHLGRTGANSLDSLTLEIGENEVFGFLGRNGAGKTTTIKILCGLLRATSGEAFICGENVKSRASRARVGYLPENPYFYEYLTPKETLEFYGRLEGLSAAARRKEWDKLSEMLDLRDIADQRLRGFSKGMRQRIGFAVALVGDPDVLILDEPMSGLDPLGRRNIRELILRLRDEKKTIFFSSHVLGDVEQICHRVGILINGRLTKAGNMSDLLAGKIRQVEIIAQGLNGNVTGPLTQSATSTRKSEDGIHFIFSNPEDAQGAVRTIVQNGGTLVACVPVKESLEDYFMRIQH